MENSQKLAFKGLAAAIGNGNGHSNGNGKKIEAYHNILKESGGLFLAEFISMGVGLGVVAVADDIAPNLMKNASKTVGKICVEPFLDVIEWGLSKSCRIKECQPDLTKSRQERAEQYAHTLVLFGAAFLPSMLTKLGIRIGMNHLLNVKRSRPLTGNWFKDYILPTKHDCKVIAWDEGVHIGAIAIMNTLAAKPTDAMVGATTGMLQKTLGWPEAKAKRVAEMAVIWELPNWLGFGSAVRHIAKYHLVDTNGASHAAKLQNSSLFNPPTP